MNQLATPAPFRWWRWWLIASLLLMQGGVAPAALPPARAACVATPIATPFTTALPTFLPYHLGAAVTVQDAAQCAGPLPVQLPLPAAQVPPDPPSQALIHIFYYDTAAQQWQRLPTQRAPGTPDWQLHAQGPAPGLYAAALASTPDYGDYQQPWQPTVTAAEVDTFTGAATWAYPLELPAGRAGFTPPLVLRYHSGLVDNLRGTQNPQASAVGLGWNLEVGYIARRIEPDANYVPRCSEDYTLVLNGVSSKLVPLGENQYRLEDEAFWRIERLPAANRGGDAWHVTTPDGVQYRFGAQDETAGADSRNSAWWMVTNGCDGSAPFRYTNWRWNLDQITDPQGNIIRLDYARETNDFVFVWDDETTHNYTAHIYSAAPLTWCAGAAQCTCFLAGRLRTCHNHMAGDDHASGYVRGGHLTHITYSWPGATHKVAFEWAARSDYPAEFDSQTQIQVWQTFWSKQWLQGLTVYSADQQQVVRRYVLTTTVQGDALTLTQLQEFAAEGTALPPQTFSYLLRAGYTGNCVAGQAEQAWKPWLATISNGYGGRTEFNYTAPEDWESLWPEWQNGQILAPAESGKCWYRYRVRELTVDPGIGPRHRTVYEYRHANEAGGHHGTWVNDEFRGHPRVRVKQRAADGSVVAYQDYYFHQGVGATISTCANPVSDRNGLQGRSYRHASFTAAGQELARVETAHLYRDLGGGRRFVASAATCTYPAGAPGPHARTEYEYDVYGNVTRETHHGDVARSGDEVVREWDYALNLTGWLLRSPSLETVKTPAGQVLRQTRYAYDGQALGAAPTAGLVTQVAQGRADWDWVTTRTAYHPWGSPRTITDTRGYATQISYDPTGQFPLRTTNARGHTTAAHWDARLGVPTVITAATGAVTHITYDALGRVQTLTPPGDAFPALKYTYPPGPVITAPFVITTATRSDPYLAAPQYHRTWTVYDGLGRVIQTQAQAENGWLVLQSTAYTALGQVARVSHPYTATVPGGQYLPPAWGALRYTTTHYDALGRVSQVQTADGSRTRQDYQAWRELVLDAEGRQTGYERDGLGRLIAVREYYGQYATPEWNAAAPALTRYTYDPLGNLTQVTDALGHVTRIAYDPLGRKTGLDDPSMGAWTYRYDTAGNLIAQTDAANRTVTFDYDELNRLTRKRHAGTLLAAYAYDQGAYGIGQRTAMTTTAGSAAWQYDAQGRPLAETRHIPGAGRFVTAWDYDAAGRGITTTYPTGEAVSAGYNARGLLTTLSGQAAYLTHATYTAAGQPRQLAWGNTRVTTYAYEPATLRLARLQVSGGLLDLAYGYDRVANLTHLTDARNTGQVQTFTYDARHRLLTAQTDAVGEGRYHETYAYDWLGNLITRTVEGVPITYTYGRPYGLVQPQPVPPPPAGEQRVYLPLVARNYYPQPVAQPFAVVATSAGFRAGYDLNGNQVARVELSGTTRITYTQAWDVENRLQVVTNTVTGAVTRLGYDGDGQRLWRATAEELTVYLGAVEVTLRGTERVTTTYYFGGGQRIAMRQGETLTYLHGDHLGSASLATDANGAIVSELRYHPYGEPRYGTMPTDRQFTGQRYDSAMGLYDYQARYYAPGLGRFISADAIVPNPANPQSLNRYAYVLNNPLRYTDPSGHAYCPPEANGRCIAEHEPPPYTTGRTSMFIHTPALHFFKRLPLEPTNPWTSQWFGATDFAYKYGSECNYNGYCQGYHCGIDIGKKNHEYGEPVYAGLYGIVESTTPTYGAGKYAVNIRVGHYIIVYGHLDGNIRVRPGERVSPDTILAGVGNLQADPAKGNVHLHLEIRYRNQLIYNPLLFMNDELYTALKVEIDVNVFNFTDVWTDPLNQPIVTRGGPVEWPPATTP